MQHKRRHIVVPTLLIILLVVAIALLWQFSRPVVNAELTSGEVMTMHGEVLQNVVEEGGPDSPSYLVVEIADGTIAKVEYHRGEAGCENRVFGFSIAKGELIEVRGVVTETDTISTCDSKGFYIN